jgi:hypothetical protein
MRAFTACGPFKTASTAAAEACCVELRLGASPVACVSSSACVESSNVESNAVESMPVESSAVAARPVDSKAVLSNSLRVDSKVLLSAGAVESSSERDSAKSSCEAVGSRLSL